MIVLFFLNVLISLFLKFPTSQRNGAKTKTKVSKTSVPGLPQEWGSLWWPQQVGAWRGWVQSQKQKTQAALAFGPHFFTPQASQEANHHCFALTTPSNLACFFPTNSGLASVLATL